MQTAFILLLLAVFCVITARFAKRARRDGSKIYRFITQNADSTAQTFVRFTMLMLIVFVALSAIFDLDIVLGAFAAGFVLRYVIPEGSEKLEGKLNAIGYGFLIPLFFVASGMKIDLAAIGQRPVLLVAFIFLLLLVRAVPVFIALVTSPSVRADVSRTNCLSVAFYCTTALPIIVAVTSVATSSGVMTDEVASVLVAAGAISVFLMPLLASIAYRVSDAEPIHAIQEIRSHEGTPSEVLHTHLEHERSLARARAERARARAEAARRANEEFLLNHRA
jgi:Kef-type K+ transport system membrane component KefB